MLLSFRSLIVSAALFDPRVSRSPNNHDPNNVWFHQPILTPKQVMHDLFTLTDCFLAKRRWQKIMLANDLGMPVETELAHVVDRYFVSLAQVLSILKYAFMMREAVRHGMPIDTTKVPLLMRQTEKLLAEVRASFAVFTSLVSAPESTYRPRTRGPSSTLSLSFGNPWQGPLHGLLGHNGHPAGVLERVRLPR